MDAWTIEEWAAFKRNIFDDFEYVPFNNKEITVKFIEYLSLVGLGGEEVKLFFEEYDNNCSYYLYENKEEYYQYHRMFFWLICLSVDFHWGWQFSETPLMVKGKKIIRDVAKYILRNEEDLLVKEIKEYLQKKLQYWNERSDNRIDAVHYYYKGIVKSIAPYHFFSEKIESELYPIELFEKIKQVIPVDFLTYFKYELYDVHKANKDYRRSSHPGILKEGTEISERKESLVVESNGNWTKKDFYDKWESLVNSNENDLYLQYAELITKWKEHLPVKLLRKEFESGNIACIEGILHSENEYAVRTLFAYAKMHNAIIPCVKKARLNKELINVDFMFKDKIHINEKPTNVDYYKLLIKFLAASEEIAKYISEWYSAHIVISICDTDLCKKCSQRVDYILSDISNIIDNNIEIWEKIKVYFEVTSDSITKQIFYDPFRRLTFDEYNEVEKYSEDLANDPEDGGIYEPIFDHGIIFGQKKYEDTDENKITISIWQIDKIHCRDYSRQYSRFRFWLYEHKEPDFRGLDLDDDLYKKFMYITLERPFFFPPETNIMCGDVSETIELYDSVYKKKFLRIPESLYKDQDKTFWAFQQEEQNKNTKRERCWKRYWRKFIENADEIYKNCNQPKIEKPLLPIIPEYAEYLLSRTNDMFSTAIENIPYVEYKAFLTESRKSQIKICLKNGAICQEEADELIKLTDNCDKNYYAWSDKEIKNCLSPDTDSDKLDKINAILEPEFMVRIFEKSILWVMEHRDSELWLNAPWFGMQIFNKSYNDRPAIWAKHLIEIANKWNGSENMLKRLCIALGHLREPLGSKVPIKLREMVENPKNEGIKEDINIQLSLFNHENFRKMYHKGNEIKRVELCKRELIIGQNREVREKKERE
jgi:hypothetical protein